MPEFGSYLKEKEQLISEYKKTITPLEEFSAEMHRPSYKPNKPVPTVKVLIILIIIIIINMFVGCDWSYTTNDWCMG